MEIIELNRMQKRARTLLSRVYHCHFEFNSIIQMMEDISNHSMLARWMFISLYSRISSFVSVVLSTSTDNRHDSVSLFIFWHLNWHWFLLQLCNSLLCWKCLLLQFTMVNFPYGYLFITFVWPFVNVLQHEVPDFFLLLWKCISVSEWA